MVDLSDIGPAIETVTVRGRPIEVRGLQFSEIFELGRGFPELAKLLTGVGADLPALMKSSDRAINAIIVAASNISNGVDNLALSEKAKLMAAVIRWTMPDGFGPFVEVMVALGLTTPAPAENVASFAHLKPLPPGAVRVRRKSLQEASAA